MLIIGRMAEGQRGFAHKKTLGKYETSLKIFGRREREIEREYYPCGPTPFLAH